MNNMEEDGTHSCLLKKMDQIKDEAELGSSHTKDQLLPQRLQSSASSCVSMKSDWSKELNPPDFRAEPGPSVSKDQLLPQRLQSSASSCVSMKSDWSKELNPPDFRAESRPSDSKDQLLTQRLQSSASSCVSMKSDWSKELNPPDFRAEPGPSDSKDQLLTQRLQSSVCSCVSMKSDWSKELNPPDFGAELSDTKQRDRRCVCAKEQSSSCAERSNSRPSLDTDAHVGLQQLLDEHQISLRSRCEHVTQGSEEAGSGVLLNRIYTELYITEGRSEDVDTQHEVMQLDTPSKNEGVLDVPIGYNDIFKASLNQPESIRVVLTSGVAGAGKSLTVQKFCLDWAKGLENQELSAVIPLSFRELNLIRDQQHSLLTLIQLFHPELKKIKAEQLSVCKLLFIFDGLDESRLSLDFKNPLLISDVVESSSVGGLLTNLIQGHLLPSALIWITSRPAAASQIPLACVDRVTEVRGFTDAQREEFFWKRFSDEELSTRIISHIKSSRSLYVMCQIPVFCWIIAVVLEDMLTTEQSGELPTTLTDMYSYFLLVQTKRNKNKYHQKHESSQELSEADREVLLKLGRLAFEHLDKGNIMFYQEDLEQCNLDVTEASVHSGVCTEIFKIDCEIFQKPVYCFVHLSIQEFLAAVYMFHCFTSKNSEVMQDFLKSQMSSLEEFLWRVIEISLQSNIGHLDLFARFLHGLSVESNSKLLGSLLGKTENSPETIQRVINNLQQINSGDCKREMDFITTKMVSDEVSPDRRINIFHCMMEMKDPSVNQEIHKFLKSTNKLEKELSEMQCLALANMLQMSDEVLDELDLDQYRTSNEGRRRLIPAVNNCRKFRLRNCGLSEADCKTVALALLSDPSHLRELDLSGNQLQDSAMMFLCAGMENPNCRLESLKLRICGLSEDSCGLLGFALMSNPSHLRKLDLRSADLQISAVKHLCAFLENSQCRVKTLRSAPSLTCAVMKMLVNCSVSVISCAALVSALMSNPSHLTELDLSCNFIKDSGLEHLCAFLETSHCILEILRLERCRLSVISCVALASALKSNPSHLKELDLRGNKLQDSDVQQLHDLVKNPNFKLETLRLK
ncbi:NACHT, LRR and PYD domains-containing protein 3 isoform X2 [Oryzias melastigma]|uniref:NACHT, LRR and PYD domains-containing protein 3 isoform X2 n=1 Tax=Oryzias melastigma TaxID=30732 RepID=UPI00168D6B38|nr:NACHT, LRR and PYD domains-containing protein 3 isoform X2 [Oryzias melastigma]